MTSNRLLALMDLMRQIELPSRTYASSVRRAALTESDSPPNLAAIKRGNAALDDIEQAVRRWVAAHPAPSTLPDGFERKTCVTVACAACGYPYDEAEFVMHFPSFEEATNHVTSDGWDELKDGRVLCMRGDDKHDDLRRSVGVIDQDAEDTE